MDSVTWRQGASSDVLGRNAVEAHHVPFGIDVHLENFVSQKVHNSMVIRSSVHTAS